ncbi:MAG: hypothetical protein M1827_005645 [Pycnora praestabilis]|nr:MAG: hypothetical protein M1827_005645 [Pycnora praestabilis]
MADSDQLLVPRQPPVSRLSVRNAFDSLTSKEQLYAHHMARAAWYGTRIILRQVSPESTPIFDFILELYRSCEGQWPQLAERTAVPMSQVYTFLEYSAVFLGNIGNYYGRGDQKFNPRISEEDLKKLSTVSEIATRLYHHLSSAIFAKRPSILGFPSNVAQSSYYPGELRISRQEIAEVSETLNRNSIHPENTRIRKVYEDETIHYDALQASVEVDTKPVEVAQTASGEVIQLIRGDHSEELEQICDCLEEAKKHAGNAYQKQFIIQYQKSFRSGDIEVFKDSQRTWIKDIKPSVETQFGFIEPYRDPYGTRAEFEGLVAFVDAKETKVLTTLVEDSSKYIHKLPWTEDVAESPRKGPFEQDLFEPPDFTSLQGKARLFFLRVSTQFNDIRQDVGSKNVMISNRIAAEYTAERASPAFLDPSDLAVYLKSEYNAFYIWVVLHELLGHGTGKLLTQYERDSYNFDIKSPPINPLTGRPVESWYRPGQTWTGLFGDIATSVDECRAECVGAYLMDDEELLRIFGYDDTRMSAEDITYNVYLQLGIGGLRALENYHEDDQKWGQAHSRGHFAIFRTLLDVGSSFMTVSHDPQLNTLTVHLSRSMIITHGKPALGALLLRLHIYRCTADVAACRTFYEALTKVEGVYKEWRKTVLANKKPRQVYVQANTVISENGGKVRLVEYDATIEGMVQSWAEREV